MALPTFSQEDKTVIVTGSRRGLGKAIALAFAEAGANLAISDRVTDDGLLESAAEEIRTFGHQVVLAQTDVTDKAQVAEMVQTAIDTYGRIDILVNNAGIAGGLPIHHAFNQEDRFYPIFDVTVKGTSLCSTAVAPAMKAQKSGCIINMSSMGAYLNRGGSAYSLAKTAIIDITKGMATEYGPYNIRVNAIAPGVIRSDMTAPMLAVPEITAYYEKMTPLQRLGEPEDIAMAALLLASDAAQFITGQTILVDGGIIPMDLRNLPLPGGLQALKKEDD